MSCTGSISQAVILLLLLAEFLWLCSVAAPKSVPAHPFNALIFPILRGCVQSFVAVSVSCFGVSVSVMFHFMFVHYTFSSVWVAEWPPFGK